MSKEETTFEGWAVIELFGHQRIAGHVSEQVVGGTSFIRVDVPDVDGQLGFTKFLGGSAIYAITPTTREIATVAASNLVVRPVSPWVVPTAEPQKLLPAEPDRDEEVYHE